VTLKNLEDQLNTLFKRIAAFDALTGERRQVKARIDVADVVQTVMQGHANQFKRHHILIDIEQDKPLFVHGVRGMLIQILENLLSNSVYWLKRQVEYEPGFKPTISICIDSVQKLVTVTDNGPGVDVSRSETIFQPFVSSKPTGQGRGLGLYISRELAQYHDWKLFMDPTARSIRKGRLNTFVIELGGAK
jgi:signal transduction histidine kinase